MPDRRLLHPATATSLMALLVALGTRAYAASTIATRDIQNRAVTTAKLGNGAVTTPKIRAPFAPIA